jgi:hypothetical protein
VADPRELWIAGRGQRNVEDARRKAAANTSQVMMSQTPEWYTTLSPEGKRENLSRAKNVLQHIPAVTTDQNESRNMYQMLMNQMKGGDRGARLIDKSGLPAGARRIGRTLFTDPAKSQGFFGDVGSLFSGKNKAAVRAKEYNPFPKAGFGEQFYKDQFPIASSFGNLMGLAEKSPTLSMIASLFPKKERIPLERDPRFSPVDGSADWESSVFDPIEGEFEDDIMEDSYSTFPGGFRDERILQGPFPPGISYPGYNEPVTLMGDLPPIEPETNEIFNEEVFNKIYELVHPTGQTEAEIPEYFDLYETPWNLFETLKESTKEDEFTDQEILDFLIGRGNLKDVTGGNELEDINFQLDDILEDQADVLNEIEGIKRERKINDEKAADLGLWYNI